MSREISPETPIWQLTVGEFAELVRQIAICAKGDIKPASTTLVHGLSSMAVKLGCSVGWLQKMIDNGVLKPATLQTGRSISFDYEKAIELLKKHEDGKKTNKAIRYE